MYRGSCACGKVTFEIDGELPPMDACHCTICRKISGHFGVGADVPRESLRVDGMEHITWYPSSEKVRRGFCKFCGSNLFFDPVDHERVPWTAVSMGAFDGPTNSRIREHIFVGQKGDYYEIDDGLPQFDEIPGP